MMKVVEFKDITTRKKIANLLKYRISDHAAMRFHEREQIQCPSQRFSDVVNDIMENQSFRKKTEYGGDAVVSINHLGIILIVSKENEIITTYPNYVWGCSRIKYVPEVLS